MYKKFKPEAGINIVCLLITAIAPVIAIGPIIGGAVGLVAAFGLLAAMKYQQDPTQKIRQAAYAAVWVIRIFVVAIEQMAYQDGFTLRQSLPFGWSATTWGWIVPIFMGTLDLLAYALTAARAAAAAERTEHETNLKRADELDNARRQREAEEKEKERRFELEKLELAAETERLRIAEDAAARKEEARSKAEAKAEAARSKAETERKQAEEARKMKEIEAEASKRQDEAKAKQAEADKKEREARQQKEEAERAQKQREEREKREREQREWEEREAAAREAREKEEREREEARQKLQTWQKASPEARTALIEAAKEEIERGGKAPTQAMIGAIVGISEKTVGTHISQYMKHQQQPVEA